MTIGTGSGMHQNHAPHDVSSVTLPKRIWPAGVTKDVQKLGYYSASARSIATMSRNEFNCTITRRQVNNMAGFIRIAANLQECGLFPDTDNVSDPDKMIAYFQKKEIPHIILSHHKDANLFEFQGQSMNSRKKNSKIVSQDKENTNNGPMNETITDGYVTMEHNGANPTILVDNDLDKMIEYGNDSRSSLQVPNDQTIMLSFMWCAPHCRRMFQAYPEVIYRISLF